MEVIIGILLTIGAIYISVLFINFAIDAIISILETIAGPVFGIIGVLLLIGSIELFKDEDLKLRTPETLMRQGFIGFSDIRRHHIMHTVSGTFPINRAVLP